MTLVNSLNFATLRALLSKELAQKPPNNMLSGVDFQFAVSHKKIEHYSGLMKSLSFGSTDPQRDCYHDIGCYPNFEYHIKHDKQMCETRLEQK